MYFPAHRVADADPRRCRQLPLLLVLAICIATSSGLSAARADWPQFRGPNCSGMAVSSGPLPEKFSSTENVRWSADIGDGVGSPAVAAGRAFVTAMKDQETVALLAFDTKTGRQLWQRQWPTGRLADVHLTNSHASTTPAADGERVYFYFSTLGLIAVDARTGDDVWQAKLPTPFFVFKWGPAMSPVLYQDMVIFCQDDDLFPAIYAFDRTTGEVRWKDERLDMACNYSHPVVCPGAEGDDLVVAGTGMLVGYNPDTGERRWWAKALLRNIKTTPVVVDGVIYISVQSGGIANQWLASVDRAETGNGDGKLTKEEMQAFVGDTKIPDAFFERTFDRGDLNKDGFLEGKELDIAFLHPDNFAGATFEDEEPADEYVLAVRGGGRGDVTGTHVLWRKKTKYTDHIVSPFVSDGRILLVKGGGITTVFDTKSGELLRGATRIRNATDYFASPVFGDGKIYLAGANGGVVVLEDGPDYKVLAHNDLGESLLGTPAIADGQILFRSRSKLISVGNPR